MKLNKILIIAIVSLFVATSGQQVLGYGGPPVQSSSNNFTVDINSDNESYSLGESVTFSGTVNKYDEERSLRISIFDSKSNLIVTQKVSVNEDMTFSHNVSLGEKFNDGKHIVKAQYGNSKATVAIIAFEVSGDMKSAGASNAKIPDWIKTNAGWWAEGSIDDNSFVQGIQFLIKEGLMEIPPTAQGSATSNTIPDWIKTNAGWWAEGSIDDNSFVQGIQFLIKEGLMKISN
ncbi:conserved exported protein of unknown function [Nitrosopumilus piranensis]|uniref:Peptidase n=1 Tax=Nitrosopumilus piranensis TaxID=1582439 RepID=A0A0C5BUU2_9ARCH|nr:conserved exported protein of unknown function [Nitrosopumilus piranensis]